MHEDDSEEEEFVYPAVAEAEGEVSSSGLETTDASLPSSPEADMDVGEVFVYPGVEDKEEDIHELDAQQPARSPTPPYEPELEPELPLISVTPLEPEATVHVPTASTPAVPVPPPRQTTPPKRHPSPAQLESIQSAASAGDLMLLKQLFQHALQTGEIEPFALANDASPRTGLTALHAAASRGRLEIVKWRTSGASSFIFQV